MQESPIKSDNFAALMAFIEDQTGFSTKKIGRESRFNFDIGIDGDDADEFMQAYAKKFDVDLTEFEFEKYFSPEGVNPFFLFKSLFVWLFCPSKHRKIHPLYIKDLLKAIENKKWKDADSDNNP